MARSVAYAGRIGLKARNAIELVESIQRGLPFRAFERLRGEMGLTAQELAGLVAIPPRTLARRRLEGRLRPEESERVLRASRVYDGAVALFEGDKRQALAWLRAEAPGLSGRAPIEFARTEVGAREVEDLIARLEHGVFA